jgi:iron complex outermembrane receptor protein
MSPDFSTGLLNGREQVSTGDSRGVEFDQYPSELLSGVVIYKTPDGALVGQGLSGTVDLQTVRPLDFSKRVMAVNYRRDKTGLGMDNEKGHGNRFTFSYIDQFMNRQIGVAFGFARLQGKSGDTTRFEGWGNDPVSGHPTLYNGQSVKQPINGFNAWTDKYEQARNGFMGVVQYRPSKDFTSTIDLFYTKYDKNTRTHGIQMPLFDNPGNANYDRPGDLTAATLSGSNVTAGTVNNVRAVIRNDAVAFSDTSKSIGWNNKLRVNQDWTASLDLSYNSAERTGTNIETYGSSASNNLANVQFTEGSHIFVPNLNYADPNVVKLTDPQGWGGDAVQAGYVKFPHNFDKINAIRLDASRDLPEGMFFSKLTTGVNVSSRSKTREYTENLLSIKGASDRYASIAYPSGSGSAMAGDSGINIITFDPVANMGALYDLKRKDHPDIWNKDWIVNEKVATAFAKLGIDSQVGSIPLRGALGLQMIHTKQDSTAYSVDKNGGTSDADRPTAPVSDGTSYNDFLPSLNLIADLGNQQNLRFGLSKIMARPTLNQMRASGGFGYDTAKQQYSGSGGNPKLDPFRAKGIDLSYEKYWDSKAYVSAALFYKKLDTYVVDVGRTIDFSPFLLPTTVKAPTNIGIFTQPVNGNGGNLKGIELAASLPLNTLTRYLDGFGVVANASQNASAVNLPDIAQGGSGTMGLPGLSKRVASLTVYYEKNGFSARAAERYRSDFIGEVSNNTGDRELSYIQGEKVLDLQFGYEFQNGPMKGLSLLLEMNNVNDAHYIRYRKVKSNVIEDTRFGRTVLFGLNYKM